MAIAALKPRHLISSWLIMILRAAQPLAGGERCDLLFIEAASGFVVDILDACFGDLEPRSALQSCAPLIVAVQPFSINDEREPLIERESVDRGRLLLLFQGLDHALQFQALESFDSRIAQHLKGGGGVAGEHE
jgi:hypothetical protein